MDNTGTSLLKVNTSIERVGRQMAITNKLLAATNDLPELLPYRKGDKWGFCDRNKKIVIECVFDWVDFFYEGFAVVRVGEWYNYVDKKNCLLSNEPFIIAQKFSEGVGFVRNSRITGFLNKMNELEVPVEGMFASDFNDGIATIYEGGHENFYKLIDRAGNVIYDIKPGDGDISYNDGFYLFAFKKYINSEDYDRNNGACPADGEDIKLASHFDHYFRSKDGSRELTGQIEFEGHQYKGFEYARRFHNGYATVRLIYEIYSNGSATNWWKYLKYDGTFIPGSYLECGNFSCGLAPVKRGYSDKWGYINATGEIAISAKFTSASEFNSDLAIVFEQDETNSFLIINKVGDVVLLLTDIMISDDYHCDSYWSSLQIEEICKKNDYNGKYLKYRFENSLFQYLQRDGRICTIDKKGVQYWED